MATVDMFNNIFAARAISPVSTATGASGPTSGVDTAGFESVNFIMAYGVVGATAEWTHSLQDSDDGVTFTSVANTSTIVNVLGAQAGATGTQTGPTGSGDHSVWRMGYVGPKRYVKVKMANGNVSTSLISAVCELGTPHSAPTEAND